MNPIYSLDSKQGMSKYMCVFVILCLCLGLVVGCVDSTESYFVLLTLKWFYNSLGPVTSSLNLHRRGH